MLAIFHRLMEPAAAYLACIMLGTNHIAKTSLRSLDNMQSQTSQNVLPDHQADLWRKLAQQRTSRLALGFDADVESLGHRTSTNNGTLPVPR